MNRKPVWVNIVSYPLANNGARILQFLADSLLFLFVANFRHSFYDMYSESDWFHWSKMLSAHFCPNLCILLVHVRRTASCTNLDMIFTATQWSSMPTKNRVSRTMFVFFRRSHQLWTARIVVARISVRQSRRWAPGSNQMGRCLWQQVYLILFSEDIGSLKCHLVQEGKNFSRQTVRIWIKYSYVCKAKLQEVVRRTVNVVG